MPKIYISQPIKEAIRILKSYYQDCKISKTQAIIPSANITVYFRAGIVSSIQKNK